MSNAVFKRLYKNVWLSNGQYTIEQNREGMNPVACMLLAPQHLILRDSN